MVSCEALLREASPWRVLAAVAVVLVLWWALQVLEWAWWAPRRMERALRAQGLRGTRYRFLWGDLKEESRLTMAALAKPVRMDRPHDVFPRVSPLLHRVVQEHGMQSNDFAEVTKIVMLLKLSNKSAGKLSFTWFGTIPRVTITDPQQAREVMSNKDGYFVKTKISTRIMKFLIGGVAIVDGEKWVKHRNILNPAFHAEKLKVSFLFPLLKYLGGQSLIYDV